MIHFISGLPRSGSTLLAALLSQNPKIITAGITSPVGDMFSRVMITAGANSEYRSMISAEQRIGILRGIMMGYYGPIGDNDRVIIDVNRYWTSRMDLIAQVFPDAKVLACVREPAAVFDSFERLLRSHPLMLSKLYPPESAANVYARADHASHPVHGVLGFAWYSTKEAYYGQHRDRMLIIDYENLAYYPHNVMASIYRFLDLTYESEQHDFGQVPQPPLAKQFDIEIGLPGLHVVRRKVEARPEPPLIPPDLFRKLSWPVFWRGEEKPQ